MKRNSAHRPLISAVLFVVVQYVFSPVFAEPVLTAPLQQIDDFILAQMQQLHIPGAALVIVENDSIVHTRGFGQAFADGEAPTAQTPFFIGSLTKSFTALAVMQLVEAGKIDLDASVQNYLPWFQVADSAAAAQMTVRHLLNQTSGLSTASGRINLANFDASPDATEQQARALATLPLSHAVGSEFEYTNSNYNVLGLVVEAVSGETYANYLQTHIFTPLQMHNTFTDPILAKQHGLATGYRYWFAVPVAAPNLPIPAGSLPSGQLISCAEDMGHYMLALLNDGQYEGAQIISPASIALIQLGVAEDFEMGMSMGKYGMGWFISEDDGFKTVWHTGIVPNFFSYMALLPTQKKGIALFFNAYGYLLTPSLSEVGDNVTDILLGEENVQPQFGFMPWFQRALLIIPFLQIIGLIVTLRLLHNWHNNPRRPHGLRKWLVHILLPLCFNFLIALNLLPLLGPTRGFWMYFMPDYAWLAQICGSFAVVWGLLRTSLVFRKLWV